MTAMHYSAAELADMFDTAAVGIPSEDHVDGCEQCHLLLALVRRARGEPSDEEREVTVELVSRWVES